MWASSENGLLMTRSSEARLSRSGSRALLAERTETRNTPLRRQCTGHVGMAVGGGSGRSCRSGGRGDRGHFRELLPEVGQHVISRLSRACSVRRTVSASEWPPEPRKPWRIGIAPSWERGATKAQPKRNQGARPGRVAEVWSSTYLCRNMGREYARQLTGQIVWSSAKKRGKKKKKKTNVCDSVSPSEDGRRAGYFVGISLCRAADKQS